MNHTFQKTLISYEVFNNEKFAKLDFFKYNNLILFAAYLVLWQSGGEEGGKGGGLAAPAVAVAGQHKTYLTGIKFPQHRYWEMEINKSKMYVVRFKN